MTAHFSSPASADGALACMKSEGRPEAHILRRLLLVCAGALGAWLFAALLQTPAAHAGTAPDPTRNEQPLSAAGQSVYSLLGTAPAAVHAIVHPPLAMTVLVLHQTVRGVDVGGLQPVLTNVVRPVLTKIGDLAPKSAAPLSAPPRSAASRLAEAARPVQVAGTAARTPAAVLAQPAGGLAGRLGGPATPAATLAATGHPHGAVARSSRADLRVPVPAPTPTPTPTPDLPAPAAGSGAFDGVLSSTAPMTSAKADTSRAGNDAPARSYLLEDPSFSPD